MSKRLTIINIILVITDLIISGMVVLAFAWGAYYFNKWWLVFFTIIPLFVYGHHIIMEERGGDDDSEGT